MIPRPTEGRLVATSAAAGMRETIAPIVSTFGVRRRSLRRCSRTRIFQESKELFATKVSVATRARSSGWLPWEVRWKPASLDDHRPRVSQLLRPSAPRARTLTSMKVPSGVRAVHDGISSVNAKPGAVQREVHRPTS